MHPQDNPSHHSSDVSEEFGMVKYNWKMPYLSFLLMDTSVSKTLKSPVPTCGASFGSGLPSTIHCLR